MKKIVITGPESSGKTTLFEQLIKSFGVIGVDEYARQYIGNLNRDYNYQDILKIAKVHFSHQQKILGINQQFLIGDTDLLNLEIWCEFKYGKCHSFISDNLRNHLPDMYLLCYPDIPWEYDSQRENPNDRIDLFDIHKSKIKSLGIGFHIVKGTKEKRVIDSKRIINKICSK